MARNLALAKMTATESCAILASKSSLAIRRTLRISVARNCVSVWSSSKKTVRGGIWGIMSLGLESLSSWRARVTRLRSEADGILEMSLSWAAARQMRSSVAGCPKRASKNVMALTRMCAAC